ncbi:MAG: GntR family transcriptional regulator [Microvirga sp.]|jgi:DNA-binding GntR family transcriptional regulator|nr:GntR family transcriptional regulator [Microvirga sp.]
MSKLVFETVRRAPPLAEQIYATLREQLRSGAFNMGERLVDATLAKAMAVSRTPVREALARLVADGLLETGEGGFQIPKPTVTAMEDIFDIRRLIEPPAAARAALAMDPGTCQALDLALQAAREAEKRQDEALFLKANYAFRSAWVACVPNPRLRETIQRFDDQAGIVRRSTLVLPEARAEALKLLEQWAGAFKRADDAAAGEYAFAFIDAAARYFREIAARGEIYRPHNVSQ